ncbi:type III secretion system inner membrane ring subunit SctD [Aeromonas veronii]|uniref:Type III secretion system inner membrane ring subunit SctD n=4 Tax=Aeromonas TaxID=642 RepID=A0ABS7VAV8_9GAMM|nr:MULTISPECIES: type III secretion system inner membrane ring subunit SctD [Aeromonas]MBZ6066202.1 type III secretion system inner membrane ring subunit SctD [Aeromonas schubertii]MCF5913423.1 type III secretion system inner membrane ring subunit SctD [Aeromonas veronii]QMS76442.1 type III secretion system inner membrane ring subunit SctD [Aeromonas veronii Hm21]RDU78845.1 EscD/YscD/HrpQ family type III secretion system inner membrane ring protein [Aeromonas veronii]RDU81936.1 EscD/YscD/HrpQ 
METSFKLKLLNGPLQGQELRLPPGPFTLGAAESDLLLPLERGEQARLEVTPSGVALCSDTPCWVAGRRQGEGVLPIHAGIDLAGVHFVLAHSDEEPPAPLIARRRGKQTFPLWALLTTLALSAGAATLLWPAPPIATPSPRDWLPAALAAEPGLQGSWQGDGSLVLSGRCRASRPLMALTARLQAAGVRLQQEAICDDDLQRSVKALLASYGYPDMTVTLDPQGEAQIDGAFQGDTSDLARALDQLPGLRGWQLSDHGAQELESLITALSQGSLLDGLSARRTEHAWLLSGQLDPEQQVRLEALLERLNQGRTERPLRFIGAAGSVTELDYLPSPMAGIGGNASAPYLQLTNGMRLLPGTPVKQGMRVVAVAPDGVSLAGRQRLVFLPLHS